MIGTIFFQYLVKFGYQLNEGCATCTHLRDQMNQWGEEGCMSKLDEILIRLRVEALTQRLPFNDANAKELLIYSIKKSKLAIDSKKS